MKGHGFKNLMAENVLAVMPLVGARQSMARRRKMCWSCQKEKSTVGGHLKIVPGLMKFVCAECVAAKKEKREEAQRHAE